MIQLFQNSTIHGVGHIANASSKLWRFFWFLLLLCGIVGIFVNIVFVFMKYFSHPVISSYTLSYETFQWPEVTICNPRDPFMLGENSSRLQYWTDAVDQISAQLTAQGNIYKKHAPKVFALFSIDIGKVLVNRNIKHFATLRYDAPYRRPSIFDNTKLTFDMDSLDKDETKALFTQRVNVGYQTPCYTIQLHRIDPLDPKFVKTIYFNIKLNDRRRELFNLIGISRSIHLYITNYGRIPKDKNKIILYPGTTTTLALSQTRYQYNKDCRRDSFTVELYDATLQGTRLMEGDYRDCEEVHEQMLAVDKCKCYHPDLPVYRNETGSPRNCFNLTIFSVHEIHLNENCLRNMLRETNNSAAFTDFLQTCQQYKQRKCDFLAYRAEKATDIDVDHWSVLLKEEFQRQLEERLETASNDSRFKNKTNASSEQGSRNDINLVITRPSMFGDFYKEENEYPFSQLLSDVGGLMGLWLGMSIVGLFELAEMVYRYVINFFRNRD